MKTLKKTILLATCIAAPAYAGGGTQIVTGLVNGMTIQTSDSIANVEVHAMSFGPGFCATNITVGGKTIVVAAPPGIYSEWMIANSHIGKVSFSISKDDICDTGTQAEVRYWRD
jgi:hypothetical protein